jgi:uncharacterized protein involved in type VI secretion and phage assembly
MQGQKSNGIVIGIVTNLEDPDGLGRICVKYPHLDEQESHWARLVTLMAGPDRGTFFRPEVGDEVLVGFERGDIRFPYILGGLWNGEDKPPADDGKTKENNWRFIRSRSGHVLKFDDTKGAETVEIIDKDEKHKIIIDCSGDKIQILCDSGDVEVKAASGNVKIEAGRAVEVKASGNMTLEASGTMTIKGSTVNIN